MIHLEPTEAADRQNLVAVSGNVSQPTVSGGEDTRPTKGDILPTSTRGEDDLLGNEDNLGDRLSSPEGREDDRIFKEPRIGAEDPGGAPGDSLDDSQEGGADDQENYPELPVLSPGTESFLIKVS